MSGERPGRSLAVLAQAAFERLGDFEFMAFEGQRFRTGEMFDRTCRVCAGLARLGIAPGDRVVVLMENCPEVGVAYTAIWRAGAVVTPVVFRVGAAELAHIFADSGAVAVITTPGLTATVAEAAATAPALRHVIVVGGPPGVLPEHVSAVDFASLEAYGTADITARAGDDLAALMYTGGTTGRSKGVMLSHDNLYSSSEGAFTAFYTPGLTGGILSLPMSHAFGMIVTLVGFHAVEPGFGVLQRWFDPAGWLRLAQQHRVQHASLVPTMIQMLLAEPLEGADLSALQYVGCGAAPLAPQVRQQWERRVPSGRILEGYGCTESGAVISASTPDYNRPGSVGLPIPGYRIQVRDDDGHALGPGAAGEICVQSDGVMIGYWGAPEETAQTLRGGWLHTGDIGHLDADGYLYITDRKKDLIIRGGSNIYPRDVEDALLEHPAVATAGVVGRPDPCLGEEIVAFITLKPGQDAGPTELVAFARARMAEQYPREIRITDALPLTTVGKLDRKALRTHFAAT